MKAWKDPLITKDGISSTPRNWGWFKPIYILSTSAAQKETIDKNSEVINSGVCFGQAMLKMTLM